MPRISTFWIILPRGGYLPAKAFFACLAQREFPTTVLIRPRDVMDYLPEPDIFHDVFEMPSIVLGPEMTAQDVPGWDSVSHITMVVETEQSFGVKFHTTEIESLKNVGDLVRLIKVKTSK